MSDMDFNADPRKLGVQVAEPMTWEGIARSLFTILDDIDTADDLAKGDETLYRNLVRRHHRDRFRFATTDGYTVTFNVKEGDDNE